MSDFYRPIDISNLVLPGEVEPRFTYADFPVMPGMPFVIVHLRGEKPGGSLRMDLHKRVFLGEVPDESLRALAPVVAQHIHGVGSRPLTPVASMSSEEDRVIAFEKELAEAIVVGFQRASQGWVAEDPSFGTARAERLSRLASELFTQHFES